MATTSKRSSSTRVLTVASSSNSVSPFTSSPSSSSSSFASSTSCHSSSPSAGFFTQRRSVSPSRVNLYAPPPPTRSVRFSIAAPPPRSQVLHKRTCMCSPTTHPGSFRCALHKNSSTRRGSSDHSLPYSPNRLNMRRSAMTNSLVRIGTVEGDLMKRALAALIRPSSHQQRRRAGFQSQPSRLSVMSKAEDLL
ncbi:hypothetical protein ABFS82_05G142900 [Erythranthe guttata]|uniref:Serine-rich protein-like protein n=1 Tax=Erythranthe guttata TaxID=4155 RepID=A0A022QUK0_ERYGU|nr:PREDICTED: putative protein TPRXL [Erythranthe guttata]EYU32362.1 hypothetical protein MIMGU_mgv1a014368mg [Erythranthe guttata]|eukprot:XP_012843451.1 PREDICTED: putative protein TPRXL [Erythranthe guttata]